MKLKYLTLLLLATTLLCSCKKEDSDNVNVVFHVYNKSFGNEYKLKEELTCNIYSNMIDYAAKKNPVKTFIIPGSIKEITQNDFSKNSEYFFDCYTDDYRTTNWGYINGPIPNNTNYSFTTATTSLNVSFDVLNNICFRLQLLPNEANSSVWKPIDCMDEYGKSIWNTMDARYKNQTFTLHRDRTVEYKYQTPSNTTIKRDLIFEVTNEYTPEITNAYRIYT